MYHTPTHRSQTGPLGTGYGTVSDMATYNGYTYFFLDTPNMALEGWSSGRNAEPMSVIYNDDMWCRVKGVAVKS